MNMENNSKFGEKKQWWRKWTQAWPGPLGLGPEANLDFKFRTEHLLVELLEERAKGVVPLESAPSPSSHLEILVPDHDTRARQWTMLNSVLVARIVKPNTKQRFFMDSKSLIIPLVFEFTLGLAGSLSLVAGGFGWRRIGLTLGV